MRRDAQEEVGRTLKMVRSTRRFGVVACAGEVGLGQALEHYPLSITAIHCVRLASPWFDTVSRLQAIARL